MSILLVRLVCIRWKKKNFFRFLQIYLKSLAFIRMSQYNLFIVTFGQTCGLEAKLLPTSLQLSAPLTGSVSFNRQVHVFGRHHPCHRVHLLHQRHVIPVAEGFSCFHLNTESHLVVRGVCVVFVRTCSDVCAMIDLTVGQIVEFIRRQTTNR